MAVVQKVEILCALQKLNEKLTTEEDEFLKTNMDNNMKQFEVASSNIGKLFFYKFHIIEAINFMLFILGTKILNVAGSKIQDLN